MSFRCTSCREHQPAGARPIAQPTHKRSVTYPERQVRLRRPKVVPTPAGPRTIRTVLDKGGSGTETVKEARLCAGCAGKPDYGVGSAFDANAVATYHGASTDVVVPDGVVLSPEDLKRLNAAVLRRIEFSA